MFSLGGSLRAQTMEDDSMMKENFPLRRKSFCGYAFMYYLYYTDRGQSFAVMELSSLWCFVNLSYQSF